MPAHEVSYRRLAPRELGRVAEIDRTERIRTAYVQHGARLEETTVDWKATPWIAEGEGEHSVAQQRAFCEKHLRAGGVALGAFVNGRLVAVGVVTPHVRPGTAQLAYLQVGAAYRRSGIGGRLSDQLEEIARMEGDTHVVVSATPSANTVRFYLGRGFEPSAQPLPELLEQEPEDVHLEKRL